MTQARSHWEEYCIQLKTNVTPTAGWGDYRTDCLMFGIAHERFIHPFQQFYQARRLAITTPGKYHQSRSHSSLSPWRAYRVTEQASAEYQVHGIKKNASVIKFCFGLELEAAGIAQISHVGFARLLWRLLPFDHTRPQGRVSCALDKVDMWPQHQVTVVLNLDSQISVSKEASTKNPLGAVGKLRRSHGFKEGVGFRNTSRGALGF